MSLDIAQWLETHGLGRHARSFADNGINFDVLARLSEDDLKELGLNLGDRRRLQSAVEALSCPTAGARAASGALRAASTPLPEAARGQITVMFCDLVGSTALSARVDPEELRDVIRDYQDACSAVVVRFDGFVARYLGDGLLAYFGYPVAHEDDAERAIGAGLEIVAVVRALGRDLSVRIGIATGVVVVGDIVGVGASQEATIIGETPNLAARLQAVAEPDTVVVSATTRALAGGLFEYVDRGALQLKGLTDPMPVWSVAGARHAESRFAARQLATIAQLRGRDEELESLMRRWQRTRAGTGQLVLVAGEPGIGKSRLVQAFREHIAGESPEVHVLQCSPHHTSSPLFPLIEHVAAATGLLSGVSGEDRLDRLETWLRCDGQLPEGAAVMLAPIFGIDPVARRPPLDIPPQRQKEIALDVLASRFLAGSPGTPALLVFEDIHWIDPSSLELLERLVERLAAHPAMLVVTYRHEFEAPWVGQANATLLSLGHLEPAACAALAADVTGDRTLSEDLIEAIAKRSDGVPLFVEELTRAVLEMTAGREGGGTPVDIPQTLRDSLEARLDRLGPAKEITQIGAAIGRSFSYALLAQVADIRESDLELRLDRLLRSGLVLARGRPPEVTFTFKHALIQDTAYASLLGRRRRALHGRIAEVLLTEFPDQAEAQPEVVARHLAEAGHAEQAIFHWRKAAERSAARWNHVEAIEYFERCEAQRRSLPDTPQARTLRLELGLATATSMRIVDRHHEALAVLDDLGEDPVMANDVSLLARFHHLRGNLLFPLGRLDECRIEHEKAQAHARAAGHAELEAQALSGLGDAAYARGELLTAVRYFERCTGLARTHGLDAIYAVNLAMVAFCRYWSSTMPETLEAALGAVAFARDGGHVRAEIIACHGVHLAAIELAEFSVAREHAQRSLDLSEQIGAARFLSESEAFMACLHRIEGRPDEAEACARRALERCRSVGMAYVGPIVIGELAAVLKDPAERDALLREAEEILAAGSPIHNHILFYRGAIDICLGASRWDQARRYALALEAHTSAEPSRFYSFQVRRGLTLAALGRGERSAAVESALAELIDEARRLSAKLDLASLEGVRQRLLQDRR